MDALRAAIGALQREAWLDNQQRQQDYDVHRRTESVVMIFTSGDGWPDITVTREAGWELLQESAVPLMMGISLAKNSGRLGWIHVRSSPGLRPR